MLTKIDMTSHIKSNINTILEKIPAGVSLVVVTKNRTVNEVMAVYDEGCKILGENRVQELVKKQAALPLDIEWHMLGHLQTNKVKYIVPFAAMIQSVDSYKLIGEINKQAEKSNRVMDCLLEIRIAGESTKTGLNFEEAGRLLFMDEIRELKNIRIRGLMGMATNTDDVTMVRNEFRGLYLFWEKVKSAFHTPDHPVLSMGMSGDYEIAIGEGSNMVRIGSAIFTIP